MRIKQTSHQAQELEFFQTTNASDLYWQKKLKALNLLFKTQKKKNCFVKNTQGIFRRNWNTCVLFGIMKK